MNTSAGTNIIVSKAGRRVGLLGRVRRYITTHSANAIFFLSMITPTLQCYAGVWGLVALVSRQ